VEAEEAEAQASMAYNHRSHRAVDHPRAVEVVVVVTVAVVAMDHLRVEATDHL
jgi:hypothetical protein